MTEQGEKGDKVAAVAPDPDLVLRLSDSTLVEMDDERILVGNRRTGAYRFWPRRDEPALSRYLVWRSVSEIVTEVVSRNENGTIEAVNGELELLAEFMSLGVLDERTTDLSGARLETPGRAWQPAMRFLMKTRTTRDTIFAIPEEYNAALAERARFLRQPSAYYERAGAPVLLLSDPSTKPKRQTKCFEDVMIHRRTTRRFADTPMTEEQLSTLLYYGWGQTGTVPNPLGDVFVRKTSPSGGSLHPTEVYPVVMNVEGVPQGLYHYSVRQHALEEIALEDPRDWIATASGDQDWVSEAGVVFLTTAFLPRTAWKYHYARVSRAVISEIGFTGQAAFLTATWLGLGAFHTIALRDEIWEEKLELDPLREPVFAITGAGKLETDIDDHSRPRKETALGVETS